LLPRAFGWSDLIDAALGRTLFSVTLHAMVYFWLLPAYIGFYTLVAEAAGGQYVAPDQVDHLDAQDTTDIGENLGNQAGGGRLSDSGNGIAHGLRCYELL
jgi:hypothetical protein